MSVLIKTALLVIAACISALRSQNRGRAHKRSLIESTGSKSHPIVTEGSNEVTQIASVISGDRSAKNWRSKFREESIPWLSNFASIVQIIGVIALVLTCFELWDYLAKPELTLTFNRAEQSNSFFLEVHNNTSKAAENPLITFEIYDLNDSTKRPVNEEPIDLEFIPGNLTVGPHQLRLPNQLPGSKFFGLAIATCKNCPTNKYWFQVDYGEKGEMWCVGFGQRAPLFPKNNPEFLDSPIKYIEKYYPKRVIQKVRSRP